VLTVKYRTTNRRIQVAHVSVLEMTRVIPRASLLNFGLDYVRGGSRTAHVCAAPSMLWAASTGEAEENDRLPNAL
jgi:hypothetical protein